MLLLLTSTVYVSVIKIWVSFDMQSVLFSGGRYTLNISQMVLILMLQNANDVWYVQNANHDFGTDVI